MKERAYQEWASFDSSRKGIIQEASFSAGWEAAMERARHIIKTSYIIDEGEDIKKIILENL